MNIGDRLPNFKLKNQNGQMIESKDWIGRPLVLFFYPKNETPVCTKEACSFRDANIDFEKYDARVFGISSDDVASHKAFHAKYRLNYELLSDPGKKTRKLFGIRNDLFGFIQGRETLIFDREGMLRHKYRSQLQADKHIEQALDALKTISEKT